MHGPMNIKFTVDTLMLGLHVPLKCQCTCIRLRGITTATTAMCEFKIHSKLVKLTSHTQHLVE